MHTTMSSLHISLLHMVCMHIIQWFIFWIFVYISRTLHIAYRWDSPFFIKHLWIFRYCIYTPKTPLTVFSASAFEELNTFVSILQFCFLTDSNLYPDFVSRHQSPMFAHLFTYSCIQALCKGFQAISYLGEKKTLLSYPPPQFQKCKWPITPVSFWLVLK